MEGLTKLYGESRKLKKMQVSSALNQIVFRDILRESSRISKDGLVKRDY